MIATSYGFVTNSSTYAVVIVLPKEHYDQIKATLEELKNYDNWLSQLSKSHWYKTYLSGSDLVESESFSDKVNRSIQMVIDRILANLHMGSNICIDAEIDTDNIHNEKLSYQILALELIGLKLRELGLAYFVDELR